MAKAANVEHCKNASTLGGGYVTPVVSGDVRQRAGGGGSRPTRPTQVGELIASHVIPRPADGLVEAYLMSKHAEQARAGGADLEEGDGRSTDPYRR